jgi:hypothetical protein
MTAVIAVEVESDVDLEARKEHPGVERLRSRGRPPVRRMNSATVTANASAGSAQPISATSRGADGSQ